MLRDRPRNPLLIPGGAFEPRRIGIVGAGSIGPDIAYWLRSELPDAPLVLIDIDPKALERARARLVDYADKGVRRGKLSLDRAGQVLAELHTETDYDALSRCDWVIEAATENLLVKHSIFTDVELRVAPDALISSNTSSLPAEQLFAQLKEPQRATVTHFFAPAFRNPIVEVVDWPRLSGETLDRLRTLLARLGKVPLVCRDVPCFMLDRIFDNWCNEAALLLEHGTAAEIDTVAQSLASAGPFFVLNLANGNPIILEANALQAKSEGAHYAPAPVFASVERWRTVAPDKRVPVDRDLELRLRDRLLGILFSQSADILDREIGSNADLELGSRIAFGLRQGPLELMQQIGEEEVRRVLARLQRERPGLPTPRRDIAVYTSFERHVLVDHLADVKILTLRRPDALNALHDELNDELLRLLRRYESDPAVSGFVITGYGTKAFCAGADIERFPSVLGDAAAAAEYARTCSRVLLHLDNMRKPVVAALNGFAFGGGLELALRCHGVVAVADAVLQFPEITLGIVPGIGGMVVPFRRWPHAAETFAAMLSRAERLSAKRAHELGVLNECVPALEPLWSSAVTLVHRLCSSRPQIANSTSSLHLPATTSGVSPDGLPLSSEVLSILHRAIEGAARAPTWSEALEIGYLAFGASACTAAAREGITAFLARRTPDFQKTG